MSDKPSIKASVENLMLLHSQRELAELLAEEWCSDTKANQLRQQLTTAQAEIEALRETFVKVADYLGIDIEAAREIPGKPSQVFMAAIVRNQAEAVEGVMGMSPNSVAEYAQSLRTQADQLDAGEE